MKKFTTVESVAAPLDRANVDTDAIIPKQFLKSIRRSGFGVHLFDGWRYLDDGELGTDSAKRRLNPDFVLNKKAYKDAEILLARDNFGCGSSREHAVWALLDFGFRVIIAPSFAEIFYQNCFKNGILPVVLPASAVDELFAGQEKIMVDLHNQIVKTPTKIYHFEIDKTRKYKLLNALDDIADTLENRVKIQNFERAHRAKFPWL